MKSIKYKKLSDTEKKGLKSDYVNIFKKSLFDTTDKNGVVVKQLESMWADWKAKYDPGNTLPETVEDLLVADFVSLVDVFQRFNALGVPQKVDDGTGNLVKSQEFIELDKIFKYSEKYDTKIAKFFYDKAELLEIHTCYYCETAYVNTYEYVDNKGALQKRRQFDLDHFIPKAVCPCLGLSLFNFVPSCQVCNSRIKGDTLVSGDYKELEVLSPSSELSDYDANIAIRLRMRPLSHQLLGDRYIYFRAKVPYRKYVDFFHLEERYEFHKCEAVRLRKLKDRYPDSNIKQIAKLLHRRESSVKEDIFQLKYMNIEGRCFEKLTKDILTNHKI